MAAIETALAIGRESELHTRDRFVNRCPRWWETNWLRAAVEAGVTAITALWNRLVCRVEVRCLGLGLRLALGITQMTLGLGLQLGLELRFRVSPNITQSQHKVSCLWNNIGVSGS